MQPPLPPPSPHPERSSVLLARLVCGDDTPNMTIQDLMDGLGQRAFGLLLILVNLPNLVPTPPGTSTIFAIPMILLSVQMILGARRPWLPEGIRNRRLPRATMSMIVVKSAPYIARFEKICRPRLEFLTSGAAERAIGFFFLILGLVLALPIPGGNLPPSLAAVIISLGLIERDGRAVLIGFAVGIGALLIVVAVVGALWAATWLAVTHAWAYLVHLF